LNITREKLQQATDLVSSSDFDAWLIFVRETAQGSDSSVPLLLDGDLTWHSALVIDHEGHKTAVVGNFDADPIIASGDWDEVKTYVEDIKPVLIEVLERSVRPGKKIAVNYSESDDKADGLTHGMWLCLQNILAGTRFEGTLSSAEVIVGSLRSQKTPSEISLIRGAVKEGNRLFGFIEKIARIGVSELQIFDEVHAVMHERGLGFAWGKSGDPIVNSGPDSMVGHGVPSDLIKIAEGHIFHIDLGVEKDGYCSDVQRCWYVGENVPNDVQQALDAVNAAIKAASEFLRPGVEGWKVDDVARQSLITSGYPEYLHALGHQVGRLAHDGGTILAPKWARYGNTPLGLVREHEVYTIEPGVMVEGRGYLGIEEMVVVTADGCEFLTERQLEMPLIQC